jgi:hypothetical protein
MATTESVREFAQTKVPVKYRKKFMELMIEWDGASNVMNTYYIIPLLKMKLEEAIKAVKAENKKGFFSKLLS